MSKTKEFLWGASTAAYQVEGAYLEDGKTLSIVDRSINDSFTNTSVASDHYHHYKEDVALMKKLGLKAYRFSIAWTRILPTEDRKVNAQGIEFYTNLIDELLASGIQPVVTIYHFDLPIYLQDEYGGFSSRKIIDDFKHYCKVLYDHFGKKVTYWLTINEQSNMFRLPYLIPDNPKSKDSKLKQRYEMNHIMTLCHAWAVKLLKEINPHAKIGPAFGGSPHYPKTCKPEDILAASNANNLNNYLFLDLYFKGEYSSFAYNYMKKNDCLPTILPEDMAIIAEGKSDILGLNYYESKTVQMPQPGEKSQDIIVNSDGESGEALLETVEGMYQIIENGHLEKTQWEWEIDPIGLRVFLRDLHERYGLPMIITENGLGTVDEIIDGKIEDDNRIQYLDNHIRQIILANEEGVNVFGYCPWSFMDLISTTSGFRKRYGFVYVNRTDTELLDMKRIPKKSFYWYQNLITREEKMNNEKDS